MLWTFVVVHYNNWNEYLMPLEFTYNDSIQASINHSPFFLNIGQHIIIQVIFYRPIDTNNLTTEEFI